MSLSGGGQSSKQTSKPLTPLEMQGYYDQAMKNLAPAMPTGAAYVAPKQQTLTGGDYAALERAYTDPLDRAKTQDLQRNDQAMADRGIYTSMNAIRSNNDVAERYAPQYSAAAGQALAMKANEQSQGNQMALANAAANENAAWRKADYLGQLWGMGKASTSNSSSSGAQGGFSL